MLNVIFGTLICIKKIQTLILRQKYYNKNNIFSSGQVTFQNNYTLPVEGPSPSHSLSLENSYPFTFLTYSCKLQTRPIFTISGISIYMIREMYCHTTPLPLEWDQNCQELSYFINLLPYSHTNERKTNCILMMSLKTFT